MIEPPDHAIIEDAGRRLYAEARYDPLVPAMGGAPALALRLLGPAGIYQQPRAAAAARLATIGGRRTIVLREGLDPRRANWLCGHELAHFALDDEAWFRALALETRELWCDALGSWLCAPSSAFRVAVSSVGVRLRRLGQVFALTETSVALRVCETSVRPGVAVVTPARVHKRGTLSPVEDVSVKSLAKHPPRGLRAVPIRDEPRRTAVLAS